ncbi:MAG: hypothetical protein IPM57_10410 [Oligoflexia bacterium]|nr:hypothetical protein [Oligoflexia bacterium]
MKIGKLQQVALRDVWPKEEDDFSAWLSENLESLSDAIGINLSIIQTEKKVNNSSYEMDILCEDDNGHTIVIENQLEKTDHKHLGQALTYLINMEAQTMVWIAKDVKQEHINVINWLNETTDKQFYLVIVEAYKIDDSKPAPFFSVICKPSEEIKILGKEKKEIQLNWTAIKQRRELADTIIVPARKEGFERVFLGDNCWWSIRINKEQLSKLKYIAGYQVAPISAITHVAKIKRIVDSEKEPGKYKVIFEGPAQEIKQIPLGVKSKIQGPAYCEFSKIKDASTLDDLLNNSDYTEDDNAA